MALEARKTEITVDLRSGELLRQLQAASVEEDLSVQEIVVEAVGYWLSHRDEIEDELAASAMDRIAAESSGRYLTHDQVKDRLKK